MTRAEYEKKQNEDWHQHRRQSNREWRRHRAAGYVSPSARQAPAGNAPAGNAPASKPERTKHHRTLGIPAGATRAQIKSAYRKLAKRYHPDRSEKGGTSARRFRKVQRAYEALS